MLVYKVEMYILVYRVELSDDITSAILDSCEMPMQLMITWISLVLHCLAQRSLKLRSYLNANSIKYK